MPNHRSAIIACDFDGTVTVEDVTDLIWDAHVPFDWEAVLMPASRTGAITPLVCAVLMPISSLALLATTTASLSKGASLWRS